MLKIRILLVSLSILAVLFLTYDASAKKKKQEISRLPEISADFSLPQNEVIRGESIPFKFVINNNDNFAAELYDITPLNDALSFVLKKKGEKEVKGSLKDHYLKTGGKIPSDYKVGTFVLNPKQSKEVEGDLLRIFGDMEPGDYSFAASYRAGGGIELTSKEVSVRISPSNPVYAYSSWEYDRVTDSNIKTAWINKGKAYTLYYTENNPKNPQVTESSYPIYNFTGTKEVKISTVNRYMQNLFHLVWREANFIYAVEIEDSRAKGNPKRIKVPYANFEMIDPPFTDNEGNLHLFVAVNNPKTAKFSLALLKFYREQGDVENREFAVLQGSFNKLTKYSLFVDDKSLATLAVNLGGTISYLVYDIVGKKISKEAEKIENIKGTVSDVMIAKQFKPEKGKDATYIYYLTKDKGNRSDYTAYLYEIGEKEAKWYPVMNVYYPDTLRIAQGVMDSYLRPYYLFSSQGMKRFFKPYFSIDLDEVLPPQRAPKALCTYPQLVVSSSVSDRYGIYLRYIKDRSKFVWEFLHEIKE